MRLILQTISQKGFLLKLISKGIFSLKTFRQGGWRNTVGTRHVVASSMPLARQGFVRLTGDTTGTRGNRHSVFCYYE